MGLEAAIPKHLQRERTLPVKTPIDFEPPFPAYVARFPQDAKDLVMAVVGVQYPSAADDDGAGVNKIISFMSSSSSSSGTSTNAKSTTTPSFSELASVIDNRGFYNLAVLAYWPSKEAYAEWATNSGFQEWWDALDAEGQEAKHGWFLEIFFPAMDRLETVFSNNEVPEGAAHMREAVSGAVQQHVYWGSMRDRLPAAQTDELVGEKVPVNGSVRPTDDATTRRRGSGRVRVPGKANLTVIRSGQDWLDTYPEERELYLETMHPVLIKGMAFLRDRGGEVGCYSCRFMDIVDPATGRADRDRTFGLAYFDELGSLERWSREHQTHLDIFGGFLQYAKTLKNVISLRLFHEVMVLTPEQQVFEYVGCHDQTGMLNAAH